LAVAEALEYPPEIVNNIVKNCDVNLKMLGIAQNRL
jgi:hypothetical protein